MLCARSPLQRVLLHATTPHAGRNRHRLRHQGFAIPHGAASPLLPEECAALGPYLELNKEPNGSVGGADGEGGGANPPAPPPEGGDDLDGDDKLPPCPVDAIVGLYHEQLPDLPRVRLLNDKRKRALRKVWRWVLTSKKSDGMPRATTAEEACAWLRGYFHRATKNDFLMGRGQRSAEHAGWQCDLDFLLTDNGMKHVIEKTKGGAA